MNAGELEHFWTSGKERFKARHRWTVPPETWLSLSGDITDAAACKIISALEREPHAEVILTLNSHGGEIAAALRLYRALRAHNPPVRAHAERADSAALLVLLAADHRSSSPQASFTLHVAAYPDEYSIGGRQTAAAMRNSAAALEHSDAEIRTIIATRSRYPTWQLDADMAAETVLDGEQARLFGIVHRLIPG
jgi:ATP-dependent protease ClpP protease subunit